MRRNFRTGIAVGALAGVLAGTAVCSAVVMAFGNGGLFHSAERMDLLAADGKLRQIEQLTGSRFLYDTDPALMQEYLYKGAVASLGDPYAAYYTAEEFEEAARKDAGSYSGIGAQMSQDPETMESTFVEVYEGSPAEAAGVQAGDIIKTVDGTDVSRMELDRIASEYVLGEEGTELRLGCYRPSTGETLEFLLKRAAVAIRPVESRMLDGSIGYVRVLTFNESTPEEFRTALTALEEQGMGALVIDLRDNTGGVLSAAVEMLGMILPDGLLVRTEDRDGRGDRYISKDGQIVYESDYGYTLSAYPKEDGGELDLPIVLLVNARTASSSELFAQALRDYGKARLVGTRTYGKGIVQNTIPLGDGTAVKFTTAGYYTQSGYQIQGQGIAPDLEVEVEERAAAGTDSTAAAESHDAKAEEAWAEKTGTDVSAQAADVQLESAVELLGKEKDGRPAD